MIAHEKPRFPAMTTEEAHLRQSVLTALSGRRVGGLLLRARILRSAGTLDEQDGAATRAAGTEAVAGDLWFRCAEEIAFRVLCLTNQSVHMDAADGPAMAALLDAADPLLVEIEAALGLVLEPADIGPVAQALVIARIDCLDGEQVAATIDLALSPAIALLPAPAPFAPALLETIPVPARVVVDGPRLAPADAASLAPGDLLLIGAAPFGARLTVAGAAPTPGSIMPADRQFRPDHRSS